MTRNQTELFKYATPIAEKKIRQARSMQAKEMLRIVKSTFSAITSRFRSDATTLAKSKQNELPKRALFERGNL